VKVGWLLVTVVNFRQKYNAKSEILPPFLQQCEQREQNIYPLCSPLCTH